MQRLKRPIPFVRKNPYGREYLYIEDPEAARAISVLTGRKTISEEQMDALESLGLFFVEKKTKE